MAHQLMLEVPPGKKFFSSLLQFNASFEKVYDRHTAPTRSTIYAIRSKFLEGGSILDKPRSGRPVVTTFEKKKQTLEAGVREKPEEVHPEDYTGT
ncbi:Hypothetical predicted protein [Octopus vulgaris]|uniref:DUF4817 domain-containing protein n=1 Tax=Octopus vulgaris TaxID=6645 RepID=A0AA36B2D4_OCTVU|nr:Hypothetical predicted protein [Octopus vulgaris]